MEHTLKVNNKTVAKFMSLENAVVVGADLYKQGVNLIKINDKYLICYYNVDLSQANFKLFD